MNVLLYRRSLSLKSGAAQLMLMQAAGLAAAGANVRFAGERGRLKFLFGSGCYPHKMTATQASELAQRHRALVIDHELAVPNASIVFVHNFAAALAEYLPREISGRVLDAEARFFAELEDDVPVVANSMLVRTGLIRQFGLPESRVAVRHPGFDGHRFSVGARNRLRARARASLGCPAPSPLVGLVTSGHLAKRGAGLFLEAAERIVAQRPDVRFLIVGSRSLPAEIARNPLVREGVLQYRPKTRTPERYFAALDILLYPAVYEEFGMVVAEAQAMAVPVVTSARVGAAETLPAAYREWGLALPEASSLAEKCLELIEDRELAERLAGAALESIAGFAAQHYAAATAAIILAQKRRLR